MRKSEDYNYVWKLKWNGSCYRGWYHYMTWRDVWWVPVLITAGPAAPAYLVMLIWWLVHW